MKRILFISAVSFLNIQCAQQNEPLTFLKMARELNNPNKSLIRYANIGDFQAARELISHFKNININTADENGDTPLMHFARHKNLNAMKYLIENGARVNERNNQGQTAALLACIYINDNNDLHNALKYLKSKGAKFTIKDEQGNSANSVCGELIKKNNI